MKRLNGFVSITTLAICLSASASQTSYYPEKYKEIFKDGLLKNEGLKIALYEVLGQYHQRNGEEPDTLTLNCDNESRVECYNQRSMSYKTARKHLFGQLHLKLGDNGYYIDEVYCNKHITRRVANIGPMTVPNTKRINCEHTWPQSRFNPRFSKGLQKGDLHHLFPTDSRANSTRGNYRFGEVEATEAYQGCSDSKFGSIPTSQGPKFFFTPPLRHSGNVARALFYFSVRYQLPISPDEEATLRKWHKLDPVDLEESIRNDEIEQIQYNRNPFIDFPELVDNIDNF